MKTQTMWVWGTVAIATAMVCIAGCATTGEAERRRDDRGDLNESEERAPKLHGPKKRIGIVDFDDASHYSWGGSRNALAEAARDAATEAFVKSGAFIVIEREQIAQVLKEQGLGMTGAISPQTAAKAGKLLGLQALVTGKITDFAANEKSSGFGGYYQEKKRDFHARVSLRMIDATSGEIWLAESGEGVSTNKSTMVMGGGQQSVDQTQGKRALYQAINKMMHKVIAKADNKPWSAAVAKVGKNGKIYVTAGSDINLPIGAMLTVRKLGEEISDPSTGLVIGHEMGRTVGKLQIASHVNEKLSACVATSGARFSAGDMVTLDATKKPERSAESATRRNDEESDD